MHCLTANAVKHLADTSGAQWKHTVICFVLLLSGAWISANCPAQEPSLSAEEQRERTTAAKFLEVLLRRPNTGTSLDRVFGYHIGAGDIGELIDGLTDQAKAATDDDESGRHWMVAGLLQLQRSEDAAAIEALAAAEAKLPDNPLAAYYHGQALLMVGRTDEATAAMQRAIDLKPSRQDHLKFAGQLGRLYQRAGKTEDALRIWTQLEKSFPGDDGVRQRIARVMIEEGDLQGALTRYDALAKDARTPNDKIVFAMRAADLRAQAGDRPTAIRQFEALLGKLRPGSYLYDEARRRIEATFLSSGDYAGLAEYYETWVNDHPEDLGAVIRLARTLSIQGRGPEALSWFEKAIELAPSDPAPRLALINAYVAAENYVDAAQQYETLIELEPNNPDHFVRWGQILIEDRKQPKQARIKAAADVWKRLAKSRSDDAVIQSQVADLLRGAELVDEAIGQYQAAIALASSQPQYKEYLGEYLHGLKREDEAMEVWRSLVEGELRNQKNLIRLAEVFHQFEKPTEALKVMSEACALDPTIEDRLRYSEWLRDAEQYDAALEQIALAATATENVDERERVFAAELKTYQASGKLDQRIEQARAATEVEGSNSDAWRRLAILFNAAGKTPEALEAIENALDRDPNSIDALEIAARMYEDSGRLPLAIEKRRLLAETDSRFRNGHLQKLSSLHLRVGETDQAVAVGKELLAASSGSIEAYRFYADLCGKIGRVDQRLDTLRRCARLNPRSNEAQQMLASQLAEDFKTDQAIELYWKMLDSADDLDDRRNIVNTLTDLYLRTNRLDQLITRLEIRGRESGDRRTTIDLISTAHQQAGDLGLARQALEGLLAEDGRDTLLMERLVSLAEQAGEYDQAVALQRQLTRLAPDRKNEARLASLLIDIGEVDEAQVMWFRMTETSSDQTLLARNINRLYAAGENETAIKLAKQILERQSDDWETRFRLMVLQADQGDWETAAQTADSLIAMNLDDATLPDGGKPYERTVRTSSAQSYTPPPIRVGRLQNMYQFYQIVDDRYGYQSTMSLPQPIDFGHAKLMARYCQLKQMANQASAINDHLAGLEKAAMAADASADQVWTWYETATIAASVQQSSFMSPQNPADWTAIWRLAEIDQEIGMSQLVSLFVNRISYAQRSDIELQKLPDDRMAWLKSKAESPEESVSDQYGRGASWQMIYGSELRIAGKTDEADQYFKQHLKNAIENADSVGLVTAIQQASAYGTDEQLWPLLEDAIQRQQELRRSYGNTPVAQLLSIFTAEKRIEDGLSKGPSDATYRERVFSLMDEMLKEEATRPLQRRVIRLTGIGGPRNQGRVVAGRYVQVSVEFPPTGLGPEDPFVFAQYSVWERMKDHAGEWLESLRTGIDASESPREAIQRHLAAASVLYWEKRVDEAIEQIQQANRLASTELPQMEPELRLMSADLLLRQDRKREALVAIDSLTVYDQNTMAVREFAAARLAAAIGDRERAQLAARRLFGVRLNTDAQIELAKLMRKLDMRQLASDLVRRLRSRGGSNTDQLQSLMTYFVAQGENDQAAEVAMELLRRSAPSRRTGSRYTTTNQVRRRNALQTLSTTGRLTALIAATEEKLENAPNSQRIRSELAELYVAAGKTEKSQALLGETELKDVNSTRALEATAQQFVAAGKMDEACDAYLKLLRRKQDSFNQNFYEIKRPFDSQQRLGDLADLMIEVGVQKFTDHRVSEICSDLVRDANAVDKARALFSAMLDIPPTATNSMYSMSNIMGSASKILTDRELVMRTARFMIEASENGNTWSTLFNGYSTGSDGRHNNVTTYFVRHVSQNKENAQAVVELLRAKLQENEDWLEGKVWLALLLTANKEFDEAKELLEPLVQKEQNPQPTHDVLWLVGSLIDTHRPMQPLAERIYEYALENTTDRSNRDFQYSLKGRICNFMADIGNNSRARELALAAIADAKTNPGQQYGNPEYEAYQKIQSTLSMMEFLAKIDYPSDALRVARQFDKSLFAKAGRYQSGRQEEFEKQQNELLDQVRKLGGLATVRSMVNETADGPTAVDFAITLGDQPFTDLAVSSLWIEMLEAAADDPKNAEALNEFAVEMKTLAEKRPQDDAASAAHAIASDVVGVHQPLHDLIDRWTGDSPDDLELTNHRLRGRLLMALLLRADRGADDEEAVSARKKIAELDVDSIPGANQIEQTSFIAALAKQSQARSDQETTQRLWQHAIALAASQWMLLDLSHAAIDAGMPELSASAFATAVTAPAGPIEIDESEDDSAISLGQLLGSARPRQSTSSTSSANELDPDEGRLAQRILDLDEAWRVNKLYTKFIFDPLVELTLGKPGSRIRTLCTAVSIKPNDRIVIHSVFDRLARRASWSKRTDKLLSLLTGDDSETHLLAGLVLLHDKRGEAALPRYRAVDATALNTLPKELVMQSLLLALDDSHCRPRAFELGLALIDQNRPSQRYANIEPFDTFSLHLAKLAMDHGMKQEFVDASINNYLQLTAHDNDRYSGVSSRVTRRLGQLEKVAQLLLPKGRLAQALTYLAMRQSGFAQGFDRGNDWVGCWALESIQAMPDRQAAYQILADWTFQGDGPLQTIRTLARRQPLPAWIPPSVGGYYPPFPPVPDQSLPIATNYYSLARLAMQIDATDDLLKRLQKAQSDGRAGANTAMAISLAAIKQPVKPNLLSDVTEYLDSIQPGDGKPASQAPLAELQLASILAADPAHDEFSQKVTKALIGHTHTQSRGYLMPWVSRYEHTRGWAETSSLRSADDLSHWIRATHADAKDFSEGKTPAVWVTDGDSRIHHVCGFGTDYLWFRYPLQGNFTVEVETLDGGWRESELVFDGLQFAALAHNKSVYVKSQGNDWARFYSDVTKQNEFNRCSVTLDDESLSYRVNDRLIYREPRKNHSPWLAIMLAGDKRTSVQNIKITGQPTIARHVDLIPDDSLRGWSGQYLNAKLPTGDVNLDQHDKNENAPQRYRSGPKPDQIKNLAWTVKNGELISGKVLPQSFNGQNSIRYERPLGDGETISYEFFYEAGKTEAHPSIGRIAYVMRPTGLHLHLMAAPNTAWTIPKGFEVPLPGVDPKPLPLKTSQWNRVELTRLGTQLEIWLNGESVFDQQPQTRLGDMVFGFFHNRQQTSARIRNVRIAGPWPEQIPQSLLTFPSPPEPQ
ncbi:DUF1583 domain-containing protein [Stieleria sp. ICT_E10.1]|uniref:DUF1583 domain-containing protein n=1 Tax=Stieleria sedimenti TaxID=2976331 RepID=UPI00217FDF4C|nr:DUF1583 domain-containing protein [Stieleria sedimenti]MCS7465237.1 DUF1583 domain-containing protein [Stieleria sedimenti]